MATSSSLRRFRPFAAQRLPDTPFIYRTRVLKVQCLHQQRKLIIDAKDLAQKRDASAAILPLTISVVLSNLGPTAQTALADEVISQSSLTIAPEDLEILAASSTGSGVDQVFVSLLFGVVVLLLVVVTGGVAYMNISQFLDNRQEKEDRDKATKDLALTIAESKSGPGEEDDIVPLKRAIRVKKEKGKGFASSEFTSRR